ncbi:antitoxin Xre/MbcA/ParS toxin-binding domain-containing protein [Roseateles albus]|uniref:antitoxin Xre/MbcA/ParS toxin-binding domain-containing protein n=1 Tax=Roseateles albus TaxID=2987525 RepID=UPI00396480F6
MAEWGLSPSQQQKLLGVSKSTWLAWKGGQVRAPLKAACAERVSYILRIYAALGTHIPIPERAVAWVSLYNTAPLFGGKPALARMLGGQVGDLMVVADYLDALRGRSFS